MRAGNRKPRRVLLGLSTLVLAAGLTTAEAHPGSTFRASRATSGAPNGPSPATSVRDTTGPQMSLDGLKIAFSSDATNLVSGDTNRVSDVFVYDITTRKTERVSVSSKGAQANGASHSPAISVDGRYVAFVSAATNLVPGDTNGVEDIFIRDRVAKTTRRVSVSSSGAQANGRSLRPSISLFGRYVGFESHASNLVARDDNGLPDAFVHNTQTGRTVRLMPPAETTERDLPHTSLGDPTVALRRTFTAKPTISHDGRYRAFVRGTYERAPLEPSALDVFVYDRREREYTKIEMPPWMGAGKIMMDNPMLSADGRYVAFEAWSVLDSVAGSDEALLDNPLHVRQIYTWDRLTRGIGLVSVNTWHQPGNAASYAPSISAGGQYVAFVSDATNLVAGDTNRAPDVFVRDLVYRTTTRMTISSAAAQAAPGGVGPSISYEGRRVAFASTAGNLAGGSAGVSDVFWRDRRTDTLNSPPRFRAIAGRTINNMQQTTVQLRAVDPDDDPLRFGVLQVTHQGNAPLLTAQQGLPQGASLDPVSGTFRWTPTPDQAGSWRFIFWVDDPRGAADFRVWDVVVRSINQTAVCTADGTC